MTTHINCPYCVASPLLVTGESIYPHRPDLYHKYFYLCPDCDAYVGCHPTGDGKNPLGRLANAELRKERQLAHSSIDLYWQSGRLPRREVYKRLSVLMHLPTKDTHIGLFDLEQCKLAAKLGNTIANWT